MKIILATLLCVVSSTAAHAQLLKNPMKGSGGSTVSAAQILDKYSLAAQSTLNAYAPLLEAVGLKEDAAAATAQAKNLTQGPLSSKDLEETARSYTDITKKIEENFKDESLELGAEAKEHFKVAGINLAAASLAYVATAVDVKAYKPSAADLQAAKVAVEVGKGVPNDMSTLKNVIGMVIDYSKAKGLPIDAGLEKAMAALEF